MDGSEIVKHIPEIASAAKVVAVSVPFTAIVKRMLGPAADEVAEMWRDRVRVYRYERQVQLLKKAENIAKDGNVTLGPVSPKILFPLLEGASFEEDENLHDMWATLLVNASSPEHSRTVRPASIAVLKQMSPDEASVLTFIADRKTSPFGPRGFYPRIASDATNPPNIAFEDLLICLDGLEAVRLIRSTVVVPSTDRLSVEGSNELEDDGPYYLTDRGNAFLRACRPPEPEPKPKP